MVYPKVSVLVLNFNGKHHLKECFESLAQTDYSNYETILIDNASSDGSVEYTRTDFPWVKILALDKNYGFAQGNNLGTEGADGELLVFLNNDVRVDRRWLAELVRPTLEDKGVGLCASKVLFYDRPDVIDCAGGLISPIGAGINIGYGQRDNGRYNAPRLVGHAYGAAMLIRKDLFQEAGGFDPDYFAYYEESDLAWRCWLTGFKTMYVPTCLVYHKSGGTWSRQAQPRKVYYWQLNRLRSLLKNFEKRNMLRGLALSLVFDVYRTLRWAAQGRFGNLRAVWKGNLDFVKEVRRNLNKRAYVQSRRIKTDRELAALGVFATLGESLRVGWQRGDRV